VQNQREFTKIVGDWHIEVLDRDTLEVVQVIDKQNVITTKGLEFFAEALVSKTLIENREARLCLGVGDGTPSPSDLDLFSPIATSRKSPTIRQNGPSVEYSVRYMPEQANTFTYTEAGIFEKCNQDGTGGVLINHLMLTPSLLKDNTKLVDFYITITFA
jgi:hypothetical protein